MPGRAQWSRFGRGGEAVRECDCAGTFMHARGGERERCGRLWRRWCGGHAGEVGRLEVGEAPDRRGPPIGE
jgi:hypothetical protein